MASDAGTLDAVVVGAGLSGIAMGIGLLRKGVRSFAVLEAADDIGGTWRDNRYPGCACDVPAQLYSYSFALNPGWSRSYAPQAEILGYLRSVAESSGVAPYVRLRSRLLDAAWDEGRQVWRLQVGTPDGLDDVATRVLVMATGPLREPQVPDIPGLEGFPGRVVHSARWDPGLAGIVGRRVAVVGTGASAVQIAPQVAGRARRLTVFQRTPSWIVPRPDHAVPPDRQALYRRRPAVQRVTRAAKYWQLEARAVGFVRQPRLMRVIESVSRRHLEHQVPDASLRRALTPDYTAGCKRILVSSDFYPILARSDVDLVPSALSSVEGSTLIAADGTRREVDTLVLATGFRVSDALPELPVRGRDGVTFAERWRGGAAAYLGTSVPGFPNMFLLLGPNTGLGHSSMVFMAEAQVRHILASIAPVLAGRSAAVEVRERAYDAWDSDVQRRMTRTVWATGCRSWYLDRAGRNSTLWPGSTVRFWWLARRDPRSAYVVHPARRAVEVA